MSFAWVFNLDAEFELSSRRYTAPARLREQLAEHGAGSRALMGPDDVLAVPGIERTRIGRAWCPTARALALLHAAGVEPEPHPTEAVLRRVNHRRFAFELGGGLPGQAYVESRAALVSVIASGRWMLKRPLAFAGRGQQRIDGPLTDKQSAWIDASLREDGLIVEPLVTPTRELSAHGFVWPDGRVELGRACVQEVSRRGAFAAITLAQEPHEELIAQAARVATALHAAGYFGPFGIDAYEHEQGSCALGEINARYTLGFAVGFPRPAHTITLDLASR